MIEQLHDENNKVTKETELSDALSTARHEWADLTWEIMPPDVETIKRLIEQLKQTLTPDHDPRHHLQSFKDAAQELGKGKSKVPYLTRESAVKDDMREQFEVARDLRVKFTDFCTFQKAILDTQYRYIQKDLLPKATTSEKKVALGSICSILKSIERTYDSISALWVESYEEIRDILENKKFVINYELMKMDPWGRYDKDQLKAAKDKVDNGTPRSIVNAMQYFGGSPIDESDFGKCWITDATIRNNAAIFSELQKTAVERSRARKHEDKAKWNPEETIDLPDLTDMLIKADQMIQNVKKDMVVIGVDISILDRKSEK